MIVNKKNLQQKIFKVITSECCNENEICSPDMLINTGKNSVNGEDAEFLISYSADAINLPREYVVSHFPYGEYFEKADNPFLVPFAPFIIIYYVTLSIYRQIKNGILLLLKRPTIQYKIKEKPQLKAEYFADIMIDFLEKYQAEHNN